MLRFVKIGVPAVVAAVGIMASASLSYGNAKIAKETGAKPCTVCHVQMGKKDLNAAGKCYQEKKDLKTCSINAPGK
jgi:hypothetical protein